MATRAKIVSSGLLNETGTVVSSTLYVDNLRSLIAGGALPAGSRTPDLGRPATRVVLSRHPETKKGLLAQPFYFQCPPDSNQVTQAFNWNDYDTVGSGQFSRPAGRQLKTMDLSSLFVDYDPPFAAHRYGTRSGNPPVDVMGWLDTLEDLVLSGTPVRLTLGQPAAWGQWDLKRLGVTLRSLAVEEKAGEPDAKYLTISVVEYRSLSLALKRRGLPTTVTLYQHGDVAVYDLGDGQVSVKNPTLHSLAKRLYGDAGKWKRIALASRNRGLKAWSGNRDLQLYAKQFGAGKKGARVAKIYIPSESAKVVDTNNGAGRGTIDRDHPNRASGSGSV